MIYLILCLGLSLLFDAQSLQAQQNDRIITPLEETDFSCWQNLNCVINNEDLRAKGWILSFDETIKDYPQPRTAKLQGNNLSLTAYFDKSGTLIRGTYELKNVALPRTLLAHLTDSQYSGWTMTANRVVVYNFNAASTEYHIILDNETDTRTVTFSYSDIMELKSRNTEVLVENQH